MRDSDRSYDYASCVRWSEGEEVCACPSVCVRVCVSKCIYLPLPNSVLIALYDAGSKWAEHDTVVQQSVTELLKSGLSLRPCQ